MPVTNKFPQRNISDIFDTLYKDQEKIKTSRLSPNVTTRINKHSAPSVHLANPSRSLRREAEKRKPFSTLNIVSSSVKKVLFFFQRILKIQD